MTDFTEELERRLRAVLSLRMRAPLPTDLPVTLVASKDYKLKIIATAPPYAAWTYEEPGAWGKLLADLAAVPDDPQAPRLVLTRAVMTCSGCPSQWDAWDADGTRYYLRYRSGRGTVHRVSREESNGDIADLAEPVLAAFEHGDYLDGVIELNQFARLAGIELRLA